LRVDLRRLLVESPDALVAFPDPESERRERRIQIDLAAWASDVAAGLNTAYGDLVDLRVGAMTFPGRQLFVREHGLRGEPAESVGLSVEVLSSLAVRSGWFARQDVLVTNRGAGRQVLSTNGEMTSAVVDRSGSVVGRHVGPHPLPMVPFAIEPQESRPVPVLIGTASMIAELGYAVPPGQWWVVIGLQTQSGSMLSAPLEITVTP
jgi:hypothetical protein